MKHHIKAEVSFKTTAEGGRQGPTPSDRFGCMLGIEGKYFDCLILVSECGPIAPGERKVVPIVFLYPELAMPLAVVGTRFVLREHKEIAHGTVIEACSTG